jgi:uncharacterized protein
MPDDNKRVLEVANAAMTRGDYEGFLAHCTDDTRWEFVGEQVLEGKEAVRRYIRQTYFEPPRFDVRELIAGDDSVVAIGEIRLKDQSGVTTRSAYCDVWGVRDGKLATLRAFVVKLSCDE